MKIRLMLAALAFVAGCSGVPDPDEHGNIVATLVDGGGVTGCAPGQQGRTLTYVSAIVPTSTDAGHGTLSTIELSTWSRCCPVGTTFGQCPGGSIGTVTCAGAWPGSTCPATAPVYEALRCSTDIECGSDRTCTPIPLIGDAGVTMIVNQCLGRCTLAEGQNFGLCGRNAEICARAPNELPGSRKGVCYPVH